MKTTLLRLALLATLGFSGTSGASESGLRRIVAGNDFWCLLDDDGVKCWGLGVHAFKPGSVRLTNLWEEEACQAAPTSALCAEAKVARFFDLEAVDELWAGHQTVCARAQGKLRCAGAHPAVAETPYSGRPEQVILDRDFGCAFDGREIACWGGNAAERWTKTGFVHSDGFRNFDLARARLLRAGGWVCLEGPRVVLADQNPLVCAEPKTGLVKWKVGPNTSTAGQRPIVDAHGACLGYRDNTGGTTYDCYGGLTCSGSRIDTCWPSSVLQVEAGRRALAQLQPGGAAVWYLDSGGLGRVEYDFDGSRRYSLAGTYKVPGARAFALAVEEDVSNRWGEADPVCVLVDDSVQCYAGGVEHRQQRYQALLRDGLMVVGAAFRLESLEKSLRRTKAYVYERKAALLERIATALEARPETEARLYAVLALQPFYDDLSSPHVLQSIKPWYDRRIAQLRADGHDALGNVAWTEASREVALRIAAACLDYLKSFVTSPADLATLDRLLAAVGRTLASGASDASASAALQDIAAADDVLTRLSTLPGDGGVALMLLMIAAR